MVFGEVIMNKVLLQTLYTFHYNNILWEDQRIIGIQLVKYAAILFIDVLMVTRLSQNTAHLFVIKSRGIWEGLKGDIR